VVVQQQVAEVVLQQAVQSVGRFNATTSSSMYNNT
jgi:hypothetical protein